MNSHLPRPMLSTALAVLLGALAAPAQRTWIVDEQNGPGTDFTDIPPAVAAAAPGDVIRVRVDDRVHPWYQAPTIDGKGVQILGDPGLPWVMGLWTVVNVPPDQRVVLADMHLGPAAMIQSPGPGATLPFAGLQCRSNRGSVVLERVRYGTTWPIAGFSNLCVALGGIGLHQCDLVVISDSVFNSCWGILAESSSNLMLDNSTVQTWYGHSGLVTYALTVWNQSRAWVSASVLHGHDAIASAPLDVGYAVQVCGDSTLYVAGGAQLIGGSYGSGNGYAIRGRSSNLCGGLQLPATVVHRDPSTVVVGPIDSSWVIDTPGPVAGLEHAITQTNLHLVQHARPAAPLLLVAADITPTPWPVAGVPVWLDPNPAPLTTEFALAPGTGQRVRDIPIPPGIPSGTRFAMQSFELLPSGELLASNVTSIGVW